MCEFPNFNFGYLCKVAEQALTHIGLDPNNAHKNGPGQGANVDIKTFLAKDLL